MSTTENRLFHEEPLKGLLPALRALRDMDLKGFKEEHWFVGSLLGALYAYEEFLKSDDPELWLDDEDPELWFDDEE
jgi:hypothetical protein